jgi:hypothetical protein
MDTRIVSCNKCLQYVYIDSTWCVIQYNKRFYECKDVGLCIELRQSQQPKPSAPPIDLELDIQQQAKLELQPPCYHKTSKSIIKRINDFFFPRYNEYSKVKSI